MSRKRAPGSVWRVSADHPVTGEEVSTGSAEHPGTVFDELVVDRWLYVEQMDTHVWWINIGGVHVNVTVADGSAREVSFEVADLSDGTECRGVL